MACKLLRYVFMDHEFGLYKRPPAQRLEIIPDYCDCVDEEMHEESTVIDDEKERNSKDVNLKEKPTKEISVEKAKEEKFKGNKLKENMSNTQVVKISRIGIRMSQTVTTVISPTTLVKTPVCDLVDEQMSCVVLKDIKNDIINRYKAVIVIQSHVRGYLARKCLRTPVQATPDVLKIVSSLHNENLSR